MATPWVNAGNPPSALKGQLKTNHKELNNKQLQNYKQMKEAPFIARWKKHFPLIATILLAWCATSCVEMVTNVDFPEQDPKVVVHAFLSPADTAAMVMLTWSIPITESHHHGDLRFIDNAQVFITDKKQADTQLVYNASRKLYTVSTDVFRIEADQSYHLRVEVPGKPMVTASCYVPPPNNSLHFINIDTIPNAWSSRILVDYGFTDIPQSKINYYAALVYRDVLAQDHASDSIYSRKIAFTPVGGDRYFSNIGLEGHDFRLRAESQYYDYGWDDDEDGFSHPRTITLLLMTVDEHYFRYHRALENHYPEDYFFEASHVYSNVDGGLGVFAGYNRKEVVIDFNQ